MRTMICFALAMIIFGQSVLEARISASAAARASQEQTEPKPTLKERILEVPPGTMIQVRLQDKKKIRGRLGEVTNEGFSLQTAQGNKIESQQISFNDVKSFKTVADGKTSKATWIVVGALAAIGVLVLIAAIALRSGG